MDMDSNIDLQVVTERIYDLLDTTARLLIQGLQLAGQVESSKGDIARLTGELDQLKRDHQVRQASLEQDVAVASLALERSRKLFGQVEQELAHRQDQLEIWNRRDRYNSILDRLPIIGRRRLLTRARTFVAEQAINTTLVTDAEGRLSVEKLEAFLHAALKDARREWQPVEAEQLNIKLNFQTLTEDLSTFQQRAAEKASEIDGKINALANARSRLVTWIKDLLAHFDQWHLGTKSCSPERICREWLDPIADRTCGDDLVLDAIERLADITLRARLFRLAVHYWEARWLVRTKKALERFKGFRNPREQIHDEWSFPWVREDRWRRYAMLTPCFFSTVYMAPRIFQSGDKDGKSPMLDFLDLLIVDEAGQVSPELGAIILPLAKSSLIVGDTHQIPPVHGLSRGMDKHCLQYHALVDGRLSAIDLDKTVEALQPWSASRGSLMMMAQQASAYQAHPSLPGGMLLTEHRRCQDKIIGYCNKLIYQGVLKVRTEPKLSRADRMLDSVGDMPGFYLPELGYAHVAGFSSRRGKSRVNASQSIAMTDWVARIAPLLEKKYNSSIESILGIITPFNAQRRQIENDLDRAFSWNGPRSSRCGTSRRYFFFGLRRKRSRYAVCGR